MTKIGFYRYIVVGRLSDPSDLKAAEKAKSWVMQRWFTPIIYDDQVTPEMYAGEGLILVGAWNANKVSEKANNDFFHLSVQNDGFVDTEGRQLGKTIVAGLGNLTVLWGLHKEDTDLCANIYVYNEAWKVPAIGLVLGGALLLGKRNIRRLPRL